MQRYVDSTKRPLFRGSELLRLMTMVVMLGVVGMMILRRATSAPGVGWPTRKRC